MKGEGRKGKCCGSKKFLKIDPEYREITAFSVILPTENTDSQNLRLGLVCGRLKFSVFKI